MESWSYLREDGSALCCHPYSDDPVTGRWQTLAVVGIDLAHGRLVVQDGKPCTADQQAWIRI